MDGISDAQIQSLNLNSNDGLKLALRGALWFVILSPA
jgi:hypothetical protein